MRVTDHFIDEQIRKMIQEEELQIPNHIEKKWSQTLQILPEKKEKRFNIKWLSAVAALFLLSISIYASFAQNSTESSRPNEAETRVNEPATARFSAEETQKKDIGSHIGAAYNLLEIKQAFPYEIYGFESDALANLNIIPARYQLLNINSGKEILEIVYQVGEWENGFVLRQTVVNEEMKNHVSASFTTMVDDKGQPLYEPVKIENETFYLFSMNPESGTISSGEVIRNQQWIQIQSLTYDLSAANFTMLFQALREQ